MRIIDLDTTKTVTANQTLATYVVDRSEIQSLSIAALTEYMQSSLTLPNERSVFINRRLVTGAGQRIIAAENELTLELVRGADIHLRLQPTSGSHDNCVVELPAPGDALDGQNIIIKTATRRLRFFTVTAADGTTVNGGTTDLFAADTSMQYKFAQRTKTWYRLR